MASNDLVLLTWAHSQHVKQTIYWYRVWFMTDCGATWRTLKWSHFKGIHFPITFDFRSPRTQTLGQINHEGRCHGLGLCQVWSTVYSSTWLNTAPWDPCVSSYCKLHIVRSNMAEGVINFWPRCCRSSYSHKVMDDAVSCWRIRGKQIWFSHINLQTLSHSGVTAMYEKEDQYQAYFPCQN